MKVLHLSHSDGKSGAGIAARRIHEALNNNRHLQESRLNVNRKFNNIPNTFCNENLFHKFIIFTKLYIERLIIRLIDYSDQNFHSISLFPSKLDSQINNLDFEIVNLHWVHHEMISIESIGRINKPIVWTLHDAWSFSSTSHYPKDNLKKNSIKNNYFKKKFILDVIDKWCVKRKIKSWDKPIQIVCPSSWLAENARNSFLMKNWKISIIPNPINTRIFRPIKKKEAREILKIPFDEKLLAFGAIDGIKDLRKGGDLLISSLKFLHKINKEFSLITFGKSDSFFKNLDLDIASYNQGFISSEEHLALIYSAADILIMPSRMESFGQVASESMACGTPVIAFSSTGIKDIIDNNQNGFLINKFNCHKMASKINYLLKNESLMKSFQIKCREKAIKEWSYEKVSNQYIKLYKTLNDR